MKRIFNFTLILAATATLINGLYSGGQETAGRKINTNNTGAAADPSVQTLWNINQIAGWIRHDAMSGNNPLTYEAGVWYPRGTASVIYQDGFVWGGIVHNTRDPVPEQTLRVGGQTYFIGTTPGHIIVPGTPASPPVASDAALARIYRIRRDWQTLKADDPEVLRDAAELNNLDLSLVTPAMARAVIDQYASDWNHWPGELGAPFYDRNENRQWDPGLDEPGLQNADQVIWFACNDLDPGATEAMYGSRPIGLELQVTIWGYKTGGPLAQTSYRRCRLINKSGFRIDSMFVGQWSDADLGSYTDDLVGCDTTLEAGFCYNGYPFDDAYQLFGLPPAAIGYALLQGPLIPSPGDTAYFDFRKIADFRNLPMTSFVYDAVGDAIATPESGRYDGTLEWYNWLNGFIPEADTTNPSPYLHGSGPGAWQPTKFPLDGDPLSGIGDVDGQGDNPWPSNRRVVICSGPFRMQPGDTQEVVWAIGGGIDPAGDHLSALANLKQNLRVVRSLYGELPALPQVSHQTSYPSAITTELALQVDLRSFSGILNSVVNFGPETGPEGEFTIPLFDDGVHNDSLAGDNIWGNSLILDNRKYPYKGDLSIITPSGQQEFPGVYTDLRLRPIPELTNWRVIWENGQQDKQINFNEDVHLAFDIHNRDEVNDISSLRVINLEFDVQNPILNYENPISPGGIVTDNSLFLILFAPSQGDSLNYSYRLQFDHHSLIYSSTRPLISWEPHPSWGDTLEVISVAGSANNVLPIVADPLLLNGHTYMITFPESAESAELRWRLTDQTTSMIKADNRMIVRYYDRDFPHPVVDGIQFQVITRPPGVFGWKVPNGVRRFTWMNADGRGWEGFNGAIGWGSPAGPNGFNTGGFDAEPVPPSALKNVLLILAQVTEAGVLWNPTFDEEDPNMSYAYRYGRWFDEAPAQERFAPFIVNTGDGYSFQDFKKSVPLSAWDVDDPEHPRRLTVGFLENNADEGLLDGKYWPSDASLDNFSINGPREWLWVYDADYSETPNPEFQGDALALPLPVMYWLTVNRNGAVPFSPGRSGEDQFLILASKPNTASDTLLVAAPRVALDPDGRETIYSFNLYQNYPNPFNPLTFIRFDLPQRATVTLAVYNVLGQRVRVLFEGEMPPGKQKLSWDGRSDSGNRVSSGIYFYRLDAGDYIKTRKMLFLK